MNVGHTIPIADAEDGIEEGLRRGGADTNLRIEAIRERCEAESSRFDNRPISRPWEPLPGLKTIFHSAGRFVAPDGRRFDYVLPELARDPGLPRALIPTVEFLERGGRGERNERDFARYTERRVERDVIPVGRQRPGMLRPGHRF
jgi:hypothetical protein